MIPDTICRNTSTMATPEVHPSILLGYNRQHLTASGFDLLSGDYGVCGELEEIQENCLYGVLFPAGCIFPKGFLPVGFNEAPNWVEKIIR